MILCQREELAEEVGSFCVRGKMKAPKRFYVCNGQKCPGCKWDEKDACHHTSDITFARYTDHPDDTFEVRMSRDFGPQLWERPRGKTYGN